MSYISGSVNTDSAVLPEATVKVTTDPDQARKERAKEKLRKAEAEGSQLWATAKEKLFQPAVAGGLFSVGMCTSLVVSHVLTWFQSTLE